MRVAVAQLVVPDATAPGAAATAQAAAVRTVAEAAGAGAGLVVLPEYASGYLTRPDARLAQGLDGPFVAALQEAARERAVTVVAGVVAPRAHGRAVNVTVVIGPDGALAGRYVKAHLYDAYGARESDAFDAGDPLTDGAPLVVGVPDGAGGVLRVGVVTCYDLRFPEATRAVAVAGADVVAVGAAWASGPHKAEQLRTLVRARAIENTAYLALASQGGPERTGGSAVVDPRGVVQAQVDDGAADVTEAGLAVVELDRALLARVRQVSPVLEHRRYGVVPR